jgi:hypothetical protein
LSKCCADDTTGGQSPTVFTKPIHPGGNARGFSHFREPRPLEPARVTAIEKQTLGIGKGTPGPGRKKGVPNKTTALLKDAILQAAEAAGGAEGMVGYLTSQAATNPGPFLALLGKVLPMQVVGEDGGPVKIEFVTIYEPKP